MTATRPVYRDGTFLGTLSIDFTLDELRPYVQGFAGDGGALMIVNDFGELIAHPTATAAANTDISRFHDLLPKGLRANAPTLFEGAPMRPLRADHHLIVWQQLQHAPWQVVFLAPQPGPVAQMLDQAGWVLPLLLGSLTAMLGVTRALTTREFIRPAESLVRHIYLGCQDRATAIGRQPPQWLPWFAEVSSAFAQNRTLVTEINSKNAQLTDLNVSLARYTPRFILLLSLEPGSGGTTVGNLLAHTLAARDPSRSSVYLEYPETGQVAVDLGLNATGPLYEHPNGYDIWLSYELGQVPAAGINSLLMAKLLDRYANVVWRAGHSVSGGGSAPDWFQVRAAAGCRCRACPTG